MKEQVFALVQKYLSGPFRHSGNGWLLTKCPFHKDGEERKPSFGVNTERAIFHCFTCHRAGDIKTMLRHLGIAREKIDADVAVIQPILDRNREDREFQKSHQFINQDPFRTKTLLPESLLGIYEYMPLQLVEDGFDPRLLQDMGVGFDKMNMRITYPIRDRYGNLSGISGGRTSPEQEPKYKVYQGGYSHPSSGKHVAGDFGEWFDKDCPGYRCENHHYLWNFERVYPRLTSTEGDRTVYIVEGFKAALWMIQNGYPNTVALMGSAMSPLQFSQILELGGNVVLCLDNDEAGRRAMNKIGHMLWKPLYGRVKVINYPEGDDHTQPDDYEPDALHQLIATSKDYFDYSRTHK